MISAAVVVLAVIRVIAQNLTDPNIGTEKTGAQFLRADGKRSYDVLYAHLGYYTDN